MNDLIGGSLGGHLKAMGPVRGWECPKCERVYAPTQPMCLCCGMQTAGNVQGSVAVDLVGAAKLGGFNPR